MLKHFFKWNFDKLHSILIFRFHHFSNFFSFLIFVRFNSEKQINKKAIKLIRNTVEKESFILAHQKYNIYKLKAEEYA